jgi:hypothetical protein
MPSLLQDLRDVNRRLRVHLESIAIRQQNARAVTSQQMSALLSELLSVGAGFRAQPLPVPGNDLELDGELREYRRQVERLRDLLPSIHRELLAERARIELQRARMQSAAEWARASRQTL